MVFVYSKSLSAKVDLPWSIWAMMQKFLMLFIAKLVYQDAKLQKKLFFNEFIDYFFHQKRGDMLCTPPRYVAV
jgi:hypothetical protein